MRTHVTASQHLDADPWPVVERFLRSPDLWLPPPARTTDDGGAVVTTARLGPFLHEVRLDVGPAWTITDAAIRHLGWTPCDLEGQPVHTQLLPSFSGRLTVRHGDPGAALSLTGWYEPPGGPLGAALDRALLHRNGDATARALVEDVATRLQTPMNEETPA